MTTPSQASIDAQYLRFRTSLADITGLTCLDCKERVPSENRLQHAREHVQEREHEQD